MPASAPRDRSRPFGLPATTWQVLEGGGYIKPRARETDYTFQELVLLRTVKALKDARVPTRSINRALRDLRPWLDDNYPAGRLALDATGGPVRIREGSTLFDPGSGQYTFPLPPAGSRARVVPIMREDATTTDPAAAAHAHFLRGSDLEADDPTAARAAYEECLAGDCRHLEARINLGRLLHLAGLLHDAEAVYAAHEEPSALLFFNWGVLLEDLQRDADAIEAYGRALVHDPGLADAHFNLFLLHERLGQAQAAFRHLLAYHRLEHARQSP